VHIVKLGNFYFNLDNVGVIEDRMNVDPRNTILIDGVVDFDGAEADALRRYLQRTAVDLMGPEQTDREYLTYRERGGELAYAAWQKEHERLRSYHSKSETWWERPSNQDLVANLESELKL
jgi:hypothetical protein